MVSEKLITYIKDGGLDPVLTRLYGSDAVAPQRERYISLVNDYRREFGDGDISLFSVPGRSEISGNHTDHQKGRVIAAAIDLDIIAAASPRTDGKVTVKSKGFDPDRTTCEKKLPAEGGFDKSVALVEGVCTGLLNRGYNTVGFDAVTTSNVLKGSGLSSSAAFEVMIGNIENHFANGGRTANAELAEISQYAENVHFGKPCGLMDQTACAVGGFTYIDFGGDKAEIEKLSFSLTEKGYSLCITDTGGSHADLTPDYASVPADMKAAARVMGGEVLRPFTLSDLIANADKIRKECGDRAFLRAYHFINENARVVTESGYLRSGDLDGFFDCVEASGRSSFMWNQNAYSPSHVTEQGVPVGLALSEMLLAGTERRAVYRLHGGGFAGTMQAFVPDEDVRSYKEGMEKVFGEGRCHILHIREDGAIRLSLENK